MEEYIAFDSHKRDTWVEHVEVATGKRAVSVESCAGSDSHRAGEL